MSDNNADGLKTVPSNKGRQQQIVFGYRHSFEIPIKDRKICGEIFLPETANPNSVQKHIAVEVDKRHPEFRWDLGSYNGHRKIPISIDDFALRVLTTDNGIYDSTVRCLENKEITTLIYLEI